MTEDEAQSWLIDELRVSRETMLGLGAFVAHLRNESISQNLIAASTIDAVWARHVADSAQLVPLGGTGTWIDLGSGAGFPGLIVAALRNDRTTLVEMRRKRVEFLLGAIELLRLPATTVIQARAETLPPAAFVTISARAVAPLATLFAIGQRFAGPDTRWVLPKGRSAAAELDTARRTWQGDFRIHPSITDPDSAIIVAERVRPRKRR